MTDTATISPVRAALDVIQKRSRFDASDDSVFFVQGEQILHQIEPNGYPVAKLLTWIAKEARSLYRRRLAECNDPVSESYMAQTDKRCSKLAAICASVGLYVEWPDVRGPALRLHLSKEHADGSRATSPSLTVNR